MLSLLLIIGGAGLSVLGVFFIRYYVNGPLYDLYLEDSDGTYILSLMVTSLAFLILFGGGLVSIIWGLVLLV